LYENVYSPDLVLKEEAYHHPVGLEHFCFSLTWRRSRSMDVIQNDFNEYMESVMPPRDSVVLEMEKFAKKEDFPIVGPLVGRFLSQLVRASRVRRVFELGSGFGYSAYWMAGALPEGGVVVCTESSEENAERGMDYLRRGGLDNKVEFRIGDSLEIMGSAEGPFEFVFNDVDKHQYPEIFRLVVPRLRPGALFVSDNLLWHGKVFTKESDRDTEAIRNFTRLMFNEPSLVSTIIPLRDGLGVCLKL
jgi:predicted O-methyltransferase YrrM